MSFFQSGQNGATLVELIVVVAVLGLVFGIVIARGEAISGGLEAGSDGIVSITKMVRTYALSTTTPHRMVPTSDRSIGIEYGGPCTDPSATWTPVPDEPFELPAGVQLASTSWSVCFNTRGSTTDVHDLRLFEGTSYQDLSVLLGGSVRVGQVYRDP